MKSRPFLICLLAGAIGLFPLVNGQAGQPKAAHAKKDNAAREAELERLLTVLEARCKQMLEMQSGVHDGTQRLRRAIQAGRNKHPRPQERQAAQALTQGQKAIVGEANKVMDLLAQDGSAVAFPEVFNQLRDDMRQVQSRLAQGDVGPKTQGLQRDVIDTLREMISPFRKSGPATTQIAAAK